MKSIFSFINSFFENKVKPVKLYNDNVVEEDHKDDQEVPEQQEQVPEQKEEVPEQGNEFSGEKLFEQVKNQSMESIATNSDDLEKILEIYDDNDDTEEEKDSF